MTQVESIKTPQSVFDWRGQAAFLLISFAFAAYYLWSFPVALDDAYIYLRTAENFTQSGLWEFNPGDGFNITTSTLWIWVVTAFAFVFDGQTLSFMIGIAFVAFLILASNELRLLLRPFLGVHSALAPFAIFLIPYIETLGGHDTAISLFTGLALIRAFRDKSDLLFLWAALFYLSRPEGAVFGGIIVLIAVFNTWRAVGIQGVITKYLRGIIAGLVPILLWHGYLLASTGHFLTVTGNVKVMQAEVEGWPSFTTGLRSHVKNWINMLGGGFGAVIGFTLAAVGGIILTLRVWPLVLWGAVHFLANAIIGVAYYHWYYYPIDFLFSVSLFVGLVTLIKALFSVRKLGTLPPLAQLALSTALYFIVISVISTQFIERSVDRQKDGRYTVYTSISDKMIALSKGDDFTLLSHEVGVFGFLAPNAKIRDVVGLASPVSDKSELWDWQLQIEKYRPEYIVWPFGGEEQYKFYDTTDGYLLYDFVDVPGSGSTVLYQKAAGEAYQPVLDRLSEIKQLQAGLISANGKTHPLSIGSEIALFTHAPASLEFAVPEGATEVRVGYGYRPNAIVGDANPDGAIFNVKDENGTILFKRYVDPVNVVSHRQLMESTVKVGTATRIFVDIQPGENSNWDWTYIAGVEWFKDSNSEGLLPTSSCDLDGLDNNVQDTAGWIDQLDMSPEGGIFVRGWAIDDAQKNQVKYIVMVNDEDEYACFVPNVFRDDVSQQYNYQVGTAGFEYVLPAVAGQENVNAFNFFAVTNDGRLMILSKATP